MTDKIRDNAIEKLVWEYVAYLCCKENIYSGLESFCLDIGLLTQKQANIIQNVTYSHSNNFGQINLILTDVFRLIDP